MYIPHFLCPSVHGHLGCFHTFTVVNHSILQNSNTLKNYNFIYISPLLVVLFSAWQILIFQSPAKGSPLLWNSINLSGNTSLFFPYAPKLPLSIMSSNRTSCILTCLPLHPQCKSCPQPHLVTTAHYKGPQLIFNK